MTADEFEVVREKLGATQAEMAQALGLCHRTVQHYCYGTHRIPGPVARLVALWSRRPDLYPPNESMGAEEEVRAS